ncbi:MAG: hypothetical protein ACXW3Z_13015 [Limisphaerales bacterium]
MNKMRLKCLTRREQSQWLNNRGHVEDPFHAHESDEPKFRLRFYTPEKYSRLQTFAWHFIEEVCGKDEILFSIEDTDLNRTEQDFVFSSLWKNLREKRSFLKTPACVGSVNDAEIMAGFFGLSAAFSWRTYLYGSEDQISLFNWEGEICDIWTASKTKRDLTRKMISSWGFKRLEKGT